MPAIRRQGTSDPLADEMLRRLAARAPLGFAVFLGCLALSTAFELLRFPERRPLMSAFCVGLVALAALCWWCIARRPEWSVSVLLVFVNVTGVASNLYHVTAGASLAMGVWQLTGLLCTAALIFPWGSRNQALACVGALLSYPLYLVAGTVDPLAWSAGGAYLVIVSSLSVFGASLFARYLRRGLALSATLSEREARLQSYFDLSLVGTAIFARDGTCKEVNDELCRILGRSREDLLALPWPQMVHPAEHGESAAMFARTLSDGGIGERRDMRFVCEGGETVHAIASARGLPGPGGASDHVILLVQDITERKRAEAEREGYIERAETARRVAEDASRTKDEFLATVSHELRTPLTPILGWSNLLRKGGLSAEKAVAAIAAIERNARAQSKLVDDLLDMARVVSGKWRLSVRPTDLEPVIEAALEVVRPAADAKGVTLELSAPERPIVVPGDADRLQQVVWNLLANAVKFTPVGGRVEIALERAGGNAAIIVRDTGEGVDPQFLPHIFEQFRQADSSVTRRHGGLGLGLTIVRVLVELHGGTVRADSPGEGLGSVFTVELPLLREAAAALAAVGSGLLPAVATSLRGLRVLAVDDDCDAAALVSEALTSCGANVRMAHSAREAVEIAEHWRPDVLVSDLAMPGEDGCSLLRRLRARTDDLATVPAIAITAYAGSTDRVFAAGYQAQIMKPFDRAELAIAIERAAAGPAERH